MEPELKVTPILLEPSNENHHSRETLEKMMNDTTQKHHVRIDSAMELAWENCSKQLIPIAVLHTGNVSILNLPGEPMVEFQLYTQPIAPQRLVFISGYGDCGPVYICTEKSFNEGGYKLYASHIIPSTGLKLKSAIKGGIN